MREEGSNYVGYFANEFMLYLDGKEEQLGFFK